MVIFFKEWLHMSMVLPDSINIRLDELAPRREYLRNDSIVNHTIFPLYCFYIGTKFYHFLMKLKR